MLKKIVCLVNLLVIAYLMLFQTTELKAAWLDYDTSFGLQGVSIEQISGYRPLNVAIQSDGRILVTGYKVEISGGKNFFLRRYLTNGALDTSFGSGGEAINSQTSWFNSIYKGKNILVQADGKISVSGLANEYHAVWQFDSMGKKVKTFGQNGLKIMTQYQTDTRFSALNEQNGKLLLTFPKKELSGEPIILIRLNANGEVDQTFGTAGESLTGLQGSMGGIRHSFGTVVESDGKITISGKTPDFNYQNQILERKLANGRTDRSFLPTMSNTIGRVLPGLVKLANGKYAMWTNNSDLTVNVIKFSSTGVYESNINTGYIGSCNVDIFTSQNDGKLIYGFKGELFRVNAELHPSTIEVKSNCPNLQGLRDGVAAIQSDDKMVIAIDYNDNLMLQRLLPN